MELLDQFEVARRGPYSGGFGGISFSGDMDIALALRTIVFPTSSRYDTMYSYEDAANKRKEWIAHLQAGAGIVADSTPEDEQMECENKAAGLARAIELAESAFVNREPEQQKTQRDSFDALPLRKHAHLSSSWTPNGHNVRKFRVHCIR